MKQKILKTAILLFAVIFTNCEKSEQTLPLQEEDSKDHTVKKCQ